MALTAAPRLLFHGSAGTSPPHFPTKRAVTLPARQARIRDAVERFLDVNERSSIHLPYAGSDQDLSSGEEGLGQHSPVLLSRRQDRRPRRQRLGQVDAVAHHGGYRQGLQRRGL